MSTPIPATIRIGQTLVDFTGPVLFTCREYINSASEQRIEFTINVRPGESLPAYNDTIVVRAIDSQEIFIGVVETVSFIGADAYRIFGKETVRIKDPVTIELEPLFERLEKFANNERE